MKTTRFFLHALMLFVSLSVVFTSCNKDDDDKDNPNGSSIVGKWKFSKAEGEFKSNNPVIDQGFLESIKSYAVYNGTAELKADGTYTYTDSEGPGMGTYKVSGDKITFDVGTEDETTLTYSVSNNQLKLTLDLKQMLQKEFDAEGDVNISITKAIVTSIYDRI